MKTFSEEKFYTNAIRAPTRWFFKAIKPQKGKRTHTEASLRFPVWEFRTGIGKWYALVYIQTNKMKSIERKRRSKDKSNLSNLYS